MECIQNSLVMAGWLLNTGRHPAKFYVIRNTEMPSVLTELACIINPNEEKVINSLELQQQMTQDIVQVLLEKSFEDCNRKSDNFFCSFYKVILKSNIGCFVNTIYVSRFLIIVIILIIQLTS